MRLFEHANYNIIGHRMTGYIISGILITVSVVTIAVRGLQYGIDFRGGSELVVSFHEPVPVSEVKRVLTAAIGSEPQIRIYGTPNELQIRSSSELGTGELSDLVLLAVNQAWPGNPGEIIKADLIGPVFAHDIRDAAVYATIFSIIVIGIYILIRFNEPSFMMAVIATLVHDTIIILGLFTLLNGVMLFDMDIDQNIIAALLTIIGYSLNDTIVVFDRIRENRMLHMTSEWMGLVNRSINQTMSRTVVTSLTTFFVVAVLFFFGGAALKGFSFALMLGIVLGTYSTIFFSCPLVVDLPVRNKMKGKTKRPEGLKTSFKIN